jgi:hypothetical protein
MFNGVLAKNCSKNVIDKGKRLGEIKILSRRGRRGVRVDPIRQDVVAAASSRVYRLEASYNCADLGQAQGPLQSIDLRKNFLAKKMDARVKPAHDDLARQLETLGAFLLC